MNFENLAQSHSTYPRSFCSNTPEFSKSILKFSLNADVLLYILFGKINQNETRKINQIKDPSKNGSGLILPIIYNIAEIISNTITSISNTLISGCQMKWYLSACSTFPLS